MTSLSVGADGGVGPVDAEYPGTAVERMLSIRERARAAKLTGDWETVRRQILFAGGLKDLPDAAPGQGYTGHSFNDWNHCDLTAMAGSESSNENRGKVEGIAAGNQLGPGIAVASLQGDGLGTGGGSWSTCLLGCHHDPPRDVAHLQFKSRIAFKLVWCPPALASFVLVDDDGGLLNAGTPAAGSGLPALRERQRNFQAVAGSKYATEAEKYGTIAASSL
eukprot:CAMPEP_0171601666 /NCGR_PEP_ID=MMETSP0990-20121206/5023_1 /TAXON_ID=483369 /ORGANISM="non described non described, Strain CCMP2098" /LENGTH=219 /DNA_ID=CAMNT_0012163795 /DNA_START=118 /DNA_END=777 /DNA_ORIENTATION=-